MIYKLRAHYIHESYHIAAHTSVIKKVSYEQQISNSHMDVKKYIFRTDTSKGQKDKVLDYRYLKIL